jgi:hypothetical protein
MCNSIQCVTKVKNELSCPCDTFVESSNTAAIQMMTSLEQQWVAAKCPGTACRLPVKGSTCGTGGICRDLSYEQALAISWRTAIQCRRVPWPRWLRTAQSCILSWAPRAGEACLYPTIPDAWVFAICPS